MCPAKQGRIWSKSAIKAKEQGKTFKCGRPSCSIAERAIRLPEIYFDSSEMNGQSI